jgi:hypothetical protein
MATLYVDFENGNDNYGGTSFALLAQGANGRITSTTFSSAGASFPNDGSLIGQYLSIFNGGTYSVYNITAWVSATSLTIAAIPGGTALTSQSVDRQYFIGGRLKTVTTGVSAARVQPGDQIRVMASPSPTNLGVTGTWNGSVHIAGFAPSSTTNTTPITVNVAGGHGCSTGDLIRITGITGNTNANGIWDIVVVSPTAFTLTGSVGNGTSTTSGVLTRINQSQVILSSSLTQTIASTGERSTPWVASANVTTALSTDSKEHRNSDSIAVAAAFTTGKAAYRTIGPLDLSGYQQVSFWIRQTSGTAITAGSIDLRLCSDAIGNVPVNTLPIPVTAFASNTWNVITIDAGINLGSNINSIALYINTDAGAQTFLFSNIIACKSSSDPSSLTLSSLIGKNTAQEKTWWGIQSINGTRVILDNAPTATTTSVTQRGYYGTSGTVALWKRETLVAEGPGSNFVVNESGTSSARISYSGGWDRTSMSSQSSETWLAGWNASSGNTIFGIAALFYIDITNFGVARYGSPLSVNNQCKYINIDLLGISNSNAISSLALVGSDNKLKLGYYILNDQGINFSLGNSQLEFGSDGFRGNNANAIISISSDAVSRMFCGQVTPATIVLEANLQLQGAGSFSNLAFVFPINLGVTTLSADSHFFNKCSFSAQNFSLSSPAVIYSQQHDNTLNNHKNLSNGGVISSATDQRKTLTGISWKFQPTSTVDCFDQKPLKLSLAKVACGANTLVTVKAWMRRSNAGLTMRLVCKGGQIAGVTSDIASSVVAVNAWEEETITFTPTETDVVEITAEAWGGTTFSGWVDDLTITQA